MSQHGFWNQLAGLGLAATAVLVICREWGLFPWLAPLLPVLVVAVLGVFAVQVRASRKAFVAVGLGLAVALVMTHPDWQEILLRALGTAGFIAAFFCALATLRTVSQSSPAIQRAGRYLAAQTPGRRYAALTVGGQLFALLLNYGAIQLLGGLAMANARAEPDPELRRVRARRMLLAIQRGFISSLPWSPMGFAMAITTAMVPGSSWAQAVWPGLVTAVLMAGIGWALDRAFKPRLAVPVPPRPAAGADSMRAMLPLAFLLAVLVVSVGTLYALTDIRVAGLVIVIVPVMSMVWILMQHETGEAPLAALGRRAGEYVFRELPGYRGELTLLMMAGFIGSVGAPLLIPVKAALGLDLGALPAWAILVGFVWFIPLAGQVGMNPILAVTLVAPMLPDPAVLGVSPTAVVVAITAGWALSGASSPFTATTLLIGSFAGISATRVGLQWNGVYAVICGVVLSGWVLLYALV